MGSVTFAPLLLNSGDYFTVKLLVAHFKIPPTVDGRIVGVKDIRRLTQRTSNFWIAATGVLLTLVAIVLEMRVKRPRPPMQPQEFWSVGVFSIGYVLLSIAFFRRLRIVRLLSRLFRKTSGG